MVVRPPSEGPVILPVGGGDREIVDARDPAPHETLVVELPVLVAVRPEPVPRVVVPLVREAHGDAVALTRPEFLDQPIVELSCPLATQELLDGLPPGEEFRPIAPDAVWRVGQR